MNVKDGGQYGNQYLLIDHSTYGHYFAKWNDLGTPDDVDVLVKFHFNDLFPVDGDDYFRIVVRESGGNSDKNGYDFFALKYDSDGSLISRFSGIDEYYSVIYIRFTLVDSLGNLYIGGDLEYLDGFKGYLLKINDSSREN